MKQFAFLLSILTTQWVHADMDSAYRATCRVHARGHAGTGCVYAKDAENYYVLTNAHVAGVLSGEPMSCVFNDRGHERTVKGTTIWGSLIESAQRDQALIAIPQSQFTDFQPAIIPLAPRGATLAKGQTVLSVGCPRATWAGLWRGHIESVSGTTMDFLPIPAGGRSGSAIFDETGTYIIGLITWNAGETGRAQSIEGIYQGLLGEAAQTVYQPSSDTVQQPSQPSAGTSGGDRNFDYRKHPYTYIGLPPNDTPRLIQPGDPDPSQSDSRRDQDRAVEIYPSQQPDCPDCRRPPMQRPQRPKQPQDPGDDGQFNPAPIPPQTLPSNPYPPSANNPAPIQPNSPANPPASGCQCDNAKLIAPLIERIKCLESKIEQLSLAKGEPGPAGPKGDTGPAGANCIEPDPAKLAEQIQAHLKPFYIRVVPPAGYTDSTPPYNAVKLGQKVDLQLEPVPAAK